MSFSLFNRSFPFIDLIERQLKALREAATLLDAIVGDFQDVAERCKQIRELAAESETAADEVTRQLGLTFLRPDERKDIYELNLAIQDAMLAVKNVSTRVGLYGCHFRHGPQNLTGIVLEILAEGAGLIANVVGAPPEAGRREKVRRLKERAQIFVLVCLGETYEAEAKTLPEVLEVVKWGQIYDRLEQCVLSATRIATIIEGIVLKNV
jgi:uncharacterized protein